MISLIGYVTSRLLLGIVIVIAAALFYIVRRIKRDEDTREKIWLWKRAGLMLFSLLVVVAV